MVVGAKHQRAPRLPEAPAELTVSRLRRYVSFTFLSGRLRTGLPVAAKIAFITAGEAQMSGQLDRPIRLVPVTARSC